TQPNPTQPNPTQPLTFTTKEPVCFAHGTHLMTSLTTDGNSETEHKRNTQKVEVSIRNLN
ncbi:hypothetical protein Q9R46_25460, partial [Paenibacillus sp. RRE4]|uniref:hypothetical protein n=1 Tax=Paenibacillus sp. RRE4 TaxID=2962587 RepID=UPI00288163CD